jgi:hypothetical protein
VTDPWDCTVEAVVNPWDQFDNLIEWSYIFLKYSEGPTFYGEYSYLILIRLFNHIIATFLWKCLLSWYIIIWFNIMKKCDTRVLYDL